MSVAKFITKLENLLDITAKRAIAQKIKSEAEGDDVDVVTPEPKEDGEEEEKEEVSEQDGDVAGDNSQPDTTSDADDAQINHDIDEKPPGVTESDDVEFSVEMFDGDEEEEVTEADFDFSELEEACEDGESLDEEEELDVEPEGDQEEVSEEGDDSIDGSELDDDEEGNLGV